MAVIHKVALESDWLKKPYLAKEYFSCDST